MRWGIPERLPTPTSPSHAFGAGPSLSPLKGGEGWCASAGAQLSYDGFEHAWEIFGHITIPEADHSIAAADKLGCAHCISLLPLGMLPAIEFDREFASRIGKIYNEGADWMLPSETPVNRQLA